MNFGGGFQLPRNFGNSNMQNRNFNNGPRLAQGINNTVANKVGTINKPQRTCKAIDGTTWSSFEDASKHNQRYYREQNLKMKH